MWYLNMNRYTNDIEYRVLKRFCIFDIYGHLFLTKFLLQFRGGRE